MESFDRHGACDELRHGEFVMGEIRTARASFPLRSNSHFLTSLRYFNVVSSCMSFASRFIPHVKGNVGQSSGNFGDLMGGLIAKQTGLPVGKFIAAVNENDEFPRFLETGEYRKIEPSINCLSNAMNVGHPSNLARIVDLYGGTMNHEGAIIAQPDMDRLREDIYSASISDEETKFIIGSVFQKYHYVLEPHGAVG